MRFVSKVERISVLDKIVIRLSREVLCSVSPRELPESDEVNWRIELWAERDLHTLDIDQDAGANDFQLSSTHKCLNNKIINILDVSCVLSLYSLINHNFSDVIVALLEKSKSFYDSVVLLVVSQFFQLACTPTTVQPQHRKIFTQETFFFLSQWDRQNVKQTHWMRILWV